ncbi:MAG TPA: ATP-binding protein, partial [Bryobacteraceae bacterium]|nr:ATP-binding protein [Bryobacteraceae bacterium]
TVSVTVSPITDDNGAIIGASKVARDITELESRTQDEQKARRTAQLLNRAGALLVSELDTQKLTQKITDIATQLVGAEFGALFHNVLDERGESYTLYTLSGVPHSPFEGFPMPRNTHVFGPTFRGECIVRSDDITKDPRYGHNAPYHGMPKGHLPVRSYLAVPLIARSGIVLGGLFFGHSAAGIFAEEQETLGKGIGAQAAIALDNAALFSASQRAQDALRRSNEELTRVNEDLNQFAHSASHDLQEPLRMVSIYSQLLRRKLAGVLDAESHEYLSHTVAGALRMETLVRDLLAFTQASAISEEPAPVASAEEALHWALSNLSASIEDAGATIVRGPALPQVRIAPVQLVQILQNVIGNAIKYRRASPPVVEIDASPDGNFWRFRIKDNGIGIDAQYKEDIFGLFKRLHGAHEYPGTGLGLAICQRVVQRAGGRMWVESELGQGSEFYFTLPSGDSD